MNLYLVDIFAYEITDLTGIFFRIFLVGHSMFGTGYYPKLLGLRLGFV